ncbi:MULTISPECIES: FMN-dependent NADH-azoreductase [Olivibacter]|jgi:FMN-dependent NADH-azoreductase|uniref:FMN dependent NADH:quinone oxidoreductase n=2 Tax=Olivibacter TaxID=376469 RepID=A0ABV6HSA1_9SPHI|nr:MULTISPECIES: NAD(P)H-dependent oxidoreductase [Olivibacter]MCL4639848.1 NAD(P)H-dependent oxidoreductase [Olivibacter sp. UJ_SKK_5.1]MDM8174466.1 NAD(P)H-dependent oxidoreductase [Olivibacter sp. 47]MDX3916596.1 NAD(P)H-dependent oxidoreductase [Pseudosphingobacterium sp.]QEL01219.1 FMN-dependent NADH-azoreductase [Olivibacter sp. LS-1]
MNILHIISSPRGKDSFSIKLGNEIVTRLSAKYPGSNVKVHNLTETHFPHLEEAHLHAFMTEPSKRTEAQATAIKHSDEAIAELQKADIIVIGAPMYNFGIHSTLKAWLDHVMRAGVTFKYGAEGPEGLLIGKKVYLAISSGGIYAEGPMRSFDFTEPYLTKALNFIGLDDITTYRVEGVAIPGIQENAFEKAVDTLAI